MKTFATISQKGPIFVFFYGDWSSFPQALNECKENFESYFKRLVDDRKTAIVDDFKSMEPFFRDTENATEMHVVCQEAIVSVDNAKDIVPLFTKHTPNVYAVAVSLDTSAVAELKETLGCKVINLDRDQLARAPFRVLVAAMFNLEPLDRAS